MDLELLPARPPEPRGAIAMDTDRVVVGVSDDDASQPSAGAVYVHRRLPGGWLVSQRLEAPIADPYQGFGAAVAIDGDVLVVGAPRDSHTTGYGSVFVYRDGPAGFQLEAELLPPLGAGFFNDLGRSVAIRDGRIVAGAPSDPYPVPGAGRVHVWRFSGAVWVYEQALASSASTVARGVGIAVDVEGDRVVAAAVSGRRPSDPGPVLEFREDAGGWALTSRTVLYPALVRPESLSLDGGRLAVGDPTASAGRGRVVLLGYGDAQPPRVLQVVERPQSGAVGEGSEFGAAVALEGVQLVISERLASATFGVVASVHVFEEFAGRFEPVDAFPTPDGSHGVILAGGALLFHESHVGSDDRLLRAELAMAGRSFAYCDAAPNSIGERVSLTLEGALDIPSAADPRLVASGLPVGARAVMLVAREPGRGTIGSGALCLGTGAGVLYRSGLPLRADDHGRIAVPLGALLFEPGVTFLAGTSWCFQLAYQDAAHGGGAFALNASRGLRVTFCP